MAARRALPTSIAGYGFILSFLLACTFFAGGVNAQSLSGLKIGDSASALANIGLRPAASNAMGPFDMTRWEFPDGNELSVTVHRASKRIVFIESDWGGRISGAYADFPGFIYGKTSLADIRKRMGSNGMMFTERGPAAPIGDDLVTFNSYEIGNAVVTFVAKVSGADMKKFAAKKVELGQAAKLVSIMLSTTEYAVTTWGKPIKDPVYRRGEWK